MPRQIPKQLVIESALKGIAKAQADYEEWSGGCWLWEAPEYLAGTYVAREIAFQAGKNHRYFLTLEHGTKSAMEEAGGVGRGRLHNAIRYGGRFDLMLWWASDTPRAPIEVKNQVTHFANICADIDRIARVLDRNNGRSTFQFGMSVFYTSIESSDGPAAQNELFQRLRKIRSDTKAHISENHLPTDRKMTHLPIKVVRTSAWTVAAIVLAKESADLI